MAEQLSNTIDVTKLYDYAKELADLYRQEIQNADAKASGQLYNFQYRIEYQNNVFKVLFSLPDYWYYIEEGRGPTHKSEGGVLYKAIRQWIDIKNIVPRDGDRDSLAHAIATKIHKKGFFGENHHGKQPLEKAMAKARSQGLINEITNEIAGQLGKEVKLELSDLNNRKSLI